MLLQLSHSPSFTPLRPAHPLPPTFLPFSSCPWVITYKFFGFYISYIILTLPLSIFYLPFMPVSYTHLTLPTIVEWCRSRWSPYH